MFCMVNGNRISHTHRVRPSRQCSQCSFIFHTISSEWLVSQPFYLPFTRSLFRFFIQFLFLHSIFYCFFFLLCVLLLLFCYTWAFNSSSLPCRRSSHTYSDMSIYLSIKFYILLLFTRHACTHLGWDIHCVEHHFKLVPFCGRYLICFHSYSNISLKYSWWCTHQPDQLVRPLGFLSHTDFQSKCETKQTTTTTRREANWTEPHSVCFSSNNFELCFSFNWTNDTSEKWKELAYLLASLLACNTFIAGDKYGYHVYVCMVMRLPSSTQSLLL